jgi:hypothetical protein
MVVVWTAAITLDLHCTVDSTITTFQLLTGVAIAAVITTMVAVGAVITMPGNQVVC